MYKNDIYVYKYPMYINTVINYFLIFKGLIAVFIHKSSLSSQNLGDFNVTSNSNSNNSIWLI